MKTVTFKNAMSGFLARGRRLQAAENPWIGNFVMQLYLDWYRDSRILGATCKRGADLLIFAWGATNRAIGTDVPTDLRRMADGELKYENRKRLFLDFSRQVCPNKDLDNFDKVAANMSIVLFFDVATDGVSHGHVSIANVDTIESEIATFRECDFVKSLLMRPTTRVSIVINGAG